MVLTAGFLLFTSIHAASALTEEPTDTGRRSERLRGESPCRNTAQGLERHLCLSNFRYASNKVSRRDVRARRFVVGTEGRRLAALRERARNHRAYFVPRTHFALGRTDPRPPSERLVPFPTRRTRIDQKLADQALGRVSTRPPLQARARAANRKSARVQLCSKRDGIRLIGCLLDFGIEINERTADEETLEIWERIRSELEWLFQ